LILLKMAQTNAIMLALLVGLTATIGLVTALSMMSQTALADTGGSGSGGGSPGFEGCSHGQGSGCLGGSGGGTGSGTLRCGLGHGGHGDEIVHGGGSCFK
jgi:hypothetical protein